MEHPLVSLIIPVYNAKNHIGRCIESVRRQSYDNIEIIIINDGSSDNVSLPVCQMYAQVDKRILLVDKDNSGVSATRNLGLRLAQGKYLQFVDSDDYLEPDATALLVRKAEENAADMVIAQYFRVRPRGEQEQDEAEIRPIGFLPEGFLTKAQFAENLMEEPASFYYGVMWNKLYRLDIVRQHDLACSEELDWSEDFLFNLEYIRYAERFYSLAVPIYYYVKNPGSLCNTKIGLRNLVSTKMALFTYYKELYESLGLYEENKARIYGYLVASCEH